MTLGRATPLDLYCYLAQRSRLIRSLQSSFVRSLSVAGLLALLVACGGEESTDASASDGEDGPNAGKADQTGTYNELNQDAASRVLYEVQIRSANACRIDVGADWQREACKQKLAPEREYHGPGCGILDELHSIKLGTIDDMMEDTADYHAGITLRYIDERVGANMVWLMPLYPNNDRWNLPHECDDTGSPYAVRDYMHARGDLARRCIQSGRNEYSETPCWGNEEIDKLIQKAHERGIKIMLDVAFNHFGHNYLFYDYIDFDPTRERIANGENLNALWNYEVTYDEALLHPEILDTEDKLRGLASRDPAIEKNLDALVDHCPTLQGDDLVRAFNMWRSGFDGEREKLSCDNLYLEQNLPSFYLGSNAYDPAAYLGDNFTNNWRDVKFLYHHEENEAHTWDFVREREYLFRVMNYWVSRGVDGFRLDHATDDDGGMGSNEWKYILGKVNYYAWRRGQDRPIYLAEEFHDQMDMNHVVDVMTEGYVGDMCARNGTTKNTAHVEKALENGNRFDGHTFVMYALETHDEHRLTDGTGFDMWTGAGFWGLGAAAYGTPMLLMGQEFGEPYGLGFRRSDYIRGRFYEHENHRDDGDALVDFYGKMIRSKLAASNRALVSSDRWYLRPSDTPDRPDDRIFAQARWGDGNVLFTFFNLWRQNVSQKYFIPDELAGKLSIDADRRYKLVDVFTDQPAGDCRTGADLKWELYVEMDADTRLQWFRLELCN